MHNSNTYNEGHGSRTPSEDNEYQNYTESETSDSNYEDTINISKRKTNRRGPSAARLNNNENFYNQAATQRVHEYQNPDSELQGGSMQSYQSLDEADQARYHQYLQHQRQLHMQMQMQSLQQQQQQMRIPQFSSEYQGQLSGRSHPGQQTSHASIDREGSGMHAEGYSGGYNPRNSSYNSGLFYPADASGYEPRGLGVQETPPIGSITGEDTPQLPPTNDQQYLSPSWDQYPNRDSRSGSAATPQMDYNEMFSNASPMPDYQWSPESGRDAPYNPGGSTNISSNASSSNSPSASSKPQDYEYGSPISANQARRINELTQHNLKKKLLSPENIHQFPSLVHSFPHAANGLGQVAPATNVNFNVSTAVWEEEETVCLIVQINNKNVARRCDNNMINGTKLLNACGLSRGKRDGWLKTEKVRHVVTMGIMDFKGVWIPYERAMNFVRQEKQLDRLYPLFKADLHPILYSRQNKGRLLQLLGRAGGQKQLRKWLTGIPNSPFREQWERHLKMYSAGAERPVEPQRRRIVLPGQQQSAKQQSPSSGRISSQQPEGLAMPLSNRIMAQPQGMPHQAPSSTLPGQIVPNQAQLGATRRLGSPIITTPELQQSFDRQHYQQPVHRTPKSITDRGPRDMSLSGADARQKKRSSSRYIGSSSTQADRNRKKRFSARGSSAEPEQPSYRPHPDPEDRNYTDS